ncbi:MAG: hypothetical protein ACXV5Q_15855, partial [Frankiaceae bacterium]
RGGVERALRRVRVPVTVAGVDSDRLYPLRLQEEMAQLLGVELHVVSSSYGHDSFLIESAEVGALVREALSPSFVSFSSRPPVASPGASRLDSSASLRLVSSAGPPD